MAKIMAQDTILMNEQDQITLAGLLAKLGYVVKVGKTKDTAPTQTGKEKSRLVRCVWYWTGIEGSDE